MDIRKGFLLQHRNTLLYGLFLAMLVFLLKWIQWRFLIVDNHIEIYAGLIALFFLVLGIWVATQVVKPQVKTVIVEKEVHVPDAADFSVNQSELDKLALTGREYDVLQLLSKGYSNTEIASALHLSLSTIKTHVSNVFVKMDVKSRAQAIEKSKRLRITP